MKNIKILLLIFGIVLLTSPILVKADTCETNPRLCHTPDDCRNQGYNWNPAKNECSKDLPTVSCGRANGIPAFIPGLTSFAVTAIKYAVPIVLIITSFISVAKAMINNSADETMKVRAKVIRKFIAALFVFLVITITQFIILKVANNSEKDDIRACLNCMLNNKCD